MVKIPNDEVKVDVEMAYRVLWTFFPDLNGYQISQVKFQGDPIFRVAEYEVPCISEALEEFESEFTARTGKDPEKVRIIYGGVVICQNRIQVLYAILRGEEEMLSSRIDTIGIDLWDPKKQVCS